MWKDLDKEYVQYSWENSKRKIDFMRKKILQIEIIERAKER